MQYLISQVNNINAYLRIFNKQYRIPLPDSSNILYRPVSSRQEEVALRDSLKSDPNTTIFWLLSSTSMFSTSATNTQQTDNGQYTSTKGRIIIPDWIAPETVFAEVMTGIMDTQGETNDTAWLYTLFDGLTNNSSFPVKFNYNGRDIPAEVLIGKAKWSQEPGTVLQPKIIIYQPKDFSR